MTADADVIVIGAGLAGLTAAATAHRAGDRVIVLEAHRAGGRARTVERDGFTLNMGAHALFRGGAGMRVLTALGVRPEGAAPPLARYRGLSGGRLEQFPTGPASLTRSGLLGPRSKAQLGRLLGTLPRMRPGQLGHTTVARWLAGLRLRPDAEKVVRALLRLTTYNDDVDSFSADAALSQMTSAVRSGVLYLDGGWSSLTDALASSLDLRCGVEARGLAPRAGGVEVQTSEGTLLGGRVVVAVGGPRAVSRILPVEPDWGDLGRPVTAACLDLGVALPPEPGYVISVDDPCYVTVQSPPARQAPEGGAVVAAIRYGARTAEADRPQLEQMVAIAGVRPGDVTVQRFLARMTVCGAMPVAATGGLSGRPGIADTGVPGVSMAGDWVGPVGMLADASLASGHAAGQSRQPAPSRSSIVVG